MFNLRLVIAGVAAAALIAAPCQAQGRRYKRGKADKTQRKKSRKDKRQKEDKSFFSKEFLNQLTEQLELTKEQKAEISDVVDAAKPGYEAKQAEVKELREKMRAASREMQTYLFETKERIRNSRYYGQRLPQVNVEGDPVEQLIAQLDAAPPGQYLIVGHPAYDNEEMRALGHEGYPGDVVAAEREWQRRIFVDPRIVAYCRENGVKPMRYDEAERKE